MKVVVLLLVPIRKGKFIYRALYSTLLLKKDVIFFKIIDSGLQNSRTPRKMLKHKYSMYLLVPQIIITSANVYTNRYPIKEESYWE